MCLKIRCDGESEKFCKFFWELNKPVACAECGLEHFRNIDISLFLINYNIKENEYLFTSKTSRYALNLVR